MDSKRINHVVTLSDLVLLVKLPLLFVGAWVLPERSWKWLAASFAWAACRLKPKAFSNRVNQFASTFGINSDDPRATQAAKRASATTSESILQCFREYRWGGWTRRLAVTGGEHLVRALGQGNGAILWVQSMPYSDLLAKKALASIGYPPHHLTRPAHGFSGSRFGIRVLNPIWTRIEDRYLAERITIRNRKPFIALRVLWSRLADNCVVSITIDDDAVKTVGVPFFNVKIRLPTSPISLSLRHGVPLIPVFTIRSSDQGFKVIVGPALTPPTGASSEDSIAALAGEYASRLEHLFGEYPDQRAVLNCISLN